ncbi:MAG TPA: flagellar biosynthetic protein FliO [Anaeromyxobacteraceae bacterium]|nr:flagellar biosynthetic protein FliO [Anaeromyxobacteraceae bacterium]
MSALVVQGAAAVAILAALVYARRQLRRNGGSPLTAELDVCQRRSLGRESGVAVVRWNRREILIGYGSAGVVPLADSIDAPLEEEIP